MCNVHSWCVKMHSIYAAPQSGAKLRRECGPSNVNSPALRPDRGCGPWCLQLRRCNFVANFAPTQQFPRARFCPSLCAGGESQKGRSLIGGAIYIDRSEWRGNAYGRLWRSQIFVIFVLRICAWRGNFQSSVRIIKLRLLLPSGGE